jgi:hypothetical protein
VTRRASRTPAPTRRFSCSLTCWLNATQDDLGKGLGPGLVALLIAATDRVTAFNIAVWSWAPCAAFQSMLLFTLAHDEATLQEVLQRESLSERMDRGDEQEADIDI